MAREGSQNAPMYKSVHLCASPRASIAAKCDRGFTLIELMVTVAVLAILSALALPNMARFVANARASAIVNEYMAAINLARSEAVRLGTRVTICAASAVGTCAAGGNNWQPGFIVFTDAGVAGAVDGTDVVIKERNAQGGMFSVMGSGGYRRISYVANGQLESGFMVGGITFAPSSDGTTYRYICISRSGRPRMDELPCPP